MTDNLSRSAMSGGLWHAVLTSVKYPKDAERIICEILPEADVFDINDRLKHLPLHLSDALTLEECEKLKEAFAPSGASIEFTECEYKCKDCEDALSEENVYSHRLIGKAPMCRECREMELWRAEKEEAKKREENRRILKERLVLSAILSLGVTLVTLGCSMLLINKESPLTFLYLLIPVFAGFFCFSLCYPTDSYYLVCGAGIKLCGLKPDSIYELSIHLVLLPFILLNVTFDLMIAVFASLFTFPKIISTRIERIKEGSGEDLRPFDRF